MHRLGFEPRNILTNNGLWARCINHSAISANTKNTFIIISFYYNDVFMLVSILDLFSYRVE